LAQRLPVEVEVDRPAGARRHRPWVAGRPAAGAGAGARAGVGRGDAAEAGIAAVRDLRTATAEQCSGERDPCRPHEGEYAIVTAQRQLGARAPAGGPVLPGAEPPGQARAGCGASPRTPPVALRAADG